MTEWRAIMSLAKQPLDVECAADRPAHGTDAEDAIEITPEMIAAGRRAFDSFSLVDLVDGWQSAEEVVCEVFVAMARAGGLAPLFESALGLSHRQSMSYESVEKSLRQHAQVALSGETKVPQQDV